MKNIDYIITMNNNDVSEIENIIGDTNEYLTDAFREFYASRREKLRQISRRKYDRGAEFKVTKADAIAIWSRIDASVPLIQRKGKFPTSGEDLFREICLLQGYAVDAVHADYRLGEWQKIKSSDNILEDAPSPIKSRIYITIDDVKVRSQKNNISGHEIKKYINIAPFKDFNPQSDQGHGAVAIPIDFQLGVVYLVCQYRYPRAKWMVEAPRGFADHRKEDGYVSAAREAREEIGFEPSTQRFGPDDFQGRSLGSYSTDSGKLAEAPHFQLMPIDANNPPAKIAAEEQLLRYPVKVKLGTFFRAVFNGAAKPGDGDVIAVKPAPNIATFDDHHLNGEGMLVIEDSFTVVAGARAWRELLHQYHQYSGKKPSWWADIQVDKVIY